MKNLKTLINLFAVSAIALLLFNACGKEEKPEIKQGEVNFKFNYTVGGETFHTGQVYTIGGVAVSFDIANFYVGGINFHPETGEHILLEDQYLLVTPEETNFSITKLDEGHYHQVKFFIGVDDVENDQTETDFTSRDSKDPLGMQIPSMHWGWNGGYKYIRIDGMVDTSGDGTPDTPLGYHLGNFDSFDFISQFAFDLHNNIVEGTNELVFEFDLAKLFVGIDLSTQTDTHVFNDVDLAKEFHDNLENAISLD